MDGLIPKHGGYRKLKSFELVQLCYDVTVRFCARFVDPRSRTYDQMIQAARSGKQNIAEGSEASGTSKKTELKLTGVAWASLGELQLDYEDFLRDRGLREWEENDPRRDELVKRRCGNVDCVAKWVEQVHARSKINGERATYAELAANAVLVLIGVARPC
jgi:four helix bundle protein